MEEEIAKHITKTGTVTIGLVCKDGIVLAADRRVSLGGGGGVSYISHDQEKVITLNDRMLATNAGVASDAQKLLSYVKADIKLKELKTKTHLSVKEVANFISNMQFQHLRTPSMVPGIAHFILAGYDNLGVHLYDLSPDGHIKQYDTYAVSGAGMMQAHPIIDTEYKKNMTVQEGVDLAIKAIYASARREPSVGEGMDIYTIKKGEVKKVSAKEIVSQIKDRVRE